MSTTITQQAAQYIQQKTSHIKPKLALVLGSGLGDLANQLTESISIPYTEIPGFPMSSVAGHVGRLVVGFLGGHPVACLQGRVHTYEGASRDNFKILIRALRLLGCEGIIMTNASGSLRADVAPGRLMIINDHINFQPGNPLIGPNDEEFGPRFFPMHDAYDIHYRTRFHDVAKQLEIDLAEGVYISVAGPCFETPAEIRAFRTLGADAVGMSTVPEVIVARHCGLRVTVLAAITNFASGMSEEVITHENTLYYGNITATDMRRLIVAFMETMQNDAC